MASKASDTIFGAIQQAVIKSVVDEFGKEPEVKTHLSWALGGVDLAKNCVDHVSVLQQSWGPGDFDRGLELSSLFATAMVPRWYRTVWPERSSKDEARAVQISIKNLFSLMSPNELEITDAINLYEQFCREFSLFVGQEAPPTIRTANGTAHLTDVFQSPFAFELSKDQMDYVLRIWKSQAKGYVRLGVRDDSKMTHGVSPWLFLLYVERAARICGGVGWLDWRTQSFPVEQFVDLKLIADRRVDWAALYDDLAIWFELLALSHDVMLDTYRAAKEKLSA